MTPPTVQFIPAAGGIDWDTYEDGIWKCSSLVGGSSGAAFTGIEVQSSTSFVTTDARGIEGWATSNNRPVSRYWNTGEYPPFVAVWDETNGIWLGVAGFTALGTGRAFYDTPDISVADGADGNLNDSIGNEVYFVYLSQDPGSWSSWRNYDGPTS